MYIIGITGSTGSGKTTALCAVEELGGYTIDCDAIYHELLRHNTEMLEEINARFDGTVVNSVLDRKKLGQLVFNDAEALKELNKITHKYVSIEINRQLDREKAAGRKLAAIDAIALIESGRGKACDVTVAVTAPEAERIKRLMEREGISEEYARLRISAQKSDEWYKENCDIVLVNSGDINEFKKQCLECFSALLNKHS
jgi:dephospho-CoA kinase